MPPIDELNAKGYEITDVTRFTDEDMAVKTMTLDGVEMPSFPPRSAMYQVTARGPKGKIGTRQVVTFGFEEDLGTDLDGFIRDDAARSFLRLLADNE